MNQQALTVNEIRDKVAKYCAYQDRCHWEVEYKLSEFKLIQDAKDEIILYLIEHKFLNEERFTKSFVRGKFYQKKWGKNKIRIELKKRRIPENLIKIGLKEIDESDYLKTFQFLVEKKIDSLKAERESFKKRAKIRNYLLQKGYESELIIEIL